MNLLNRRRFVALSSAGAASAVLVACGNESATDEELNPTQVSDVAGAPPTLAPITATPGAEAAGGDEEASAGGGGPVEVDAHEMAFEPAEFTVAPGDTITVTNSGMLEHDFAVDDWGGVVVGPLAGGDSGKYTVPEDAEIGASFEFYCSIPGHKESGMVGTLTIGEVGGGAAAEEEPAAAGAASDAVAVSATEMLFDPAEFTVSPGGTITLTNDGVLEHDLAVDDWGGVLVGPLAGGDSGEYTVPDDAEAGATFEFYCSIPGHKESGMVGTLTIGEAGGGAAAGAEGASPEAEEASPEAEEAAAGAGGGGSEAVAVSATEMLFEPAEFTVAPGGTISVTNDGVLEHDFAVDDWGGVLVGPLAGGDSGEYTVPDDAEVGATFDFYCSIPGHKESGMIGTLTIGEPSGGGGAAVAAGSEDADSEGAAATAASSDFQGNVIEVVASEWAYEPAEFEAAPGDMIRLLNIGAMAHDMSSDAWGEPFIEDVPKGGTGEFIVPDDAPVGDAIEIYSVNQGATKLGMTGKVTIVEETSGSVMASATPAGGASPAATAESEAEATAEAAASGGDSGGGLVEVDAHEMAFEPAEFTVAPGDTITVTNSGVLEHDFAVDDWGGVVVGPLAGGDSGEYTVPEDAEVGATFDFYCSIPGHKESGMVGTLTIG